MFEKQSGSPILSFASNPSDGKRLTTMRIRRITPLHRDHRRGVGDITIADLAEEKGRTAAAEIAARGHFATFIRTDVSRSAEVW
jgi:hypothetical protein